MRIRITGKKLVKAQGGGTRYTYNGRTLDPNNPVDAVIIKQQEAGIAEDQAAIDAHFAQKAPRALAEPIPYQSNRTPFMAPTSMPNTFPNIQPIPQGANWGNAIPAVNTNAATYNSLMGTQPQVSGINQPNNFPNLTQAPGMSSMWGQQPLSGSLSRQSANEFGTMLNDPKQYAIDYSMDKDLDAAKNMIGQDAKNLQNTFNTGSAKETKAGIANFNSTYGTDLKDPRMIKLGAKGRATLGTIGKASQALQKGIAVAGAFTGYLDGRKLADEAKSRQRDMQMSDNLFPVTQGSRGDYVQTGSGFGEFRPDQEVVNKGMYTNQFYPAMNTAQYGGTQNISPEMKAMNTVMNNYRGYESVIPEMISMPVGLGDLDYQPVSNNNTNAYYPTSTPKSNGTPVNLGKGAKGRIAHNNPGNIHIEGGFAQKYGATTGRPDGEGHVAIFPDMQTGMKAMKDLLFGSAYNNLPISKARNKWVGYNNASTQAIVNAMGGDKKLSELSESDKSKLFGEFVKWEDRDVYNHLKSTGATFKHGGINTNDMKIRITGTPQNMEYGGQKGYGFDNGSKNVFTDMADNSYDSVSNTIPEVPRNQANIEAEKGETIYGDVDQDGSLEHMNIGGQPHTKGGTPLNVPEGSFIYSNTKNLRIKEPEVLKHFNKSFKKGGFTPAEIAKQYDINKYKAIMDNPFSDELSKKTAYIMLENYQKKLGGLALIQESKKGFPQGIPAVAQSALPKEMQQEQDSEMQEAKFGGYYQGGGEKEDYKSKAQKLSKKDLEGYEKITTEGGKTYYQKRTKVKDAVAGIKGAPGIAGSPEVKGAIPGGTPGIAWENWLKDQLAKGVTIEELAKKGHGTLPGLEKYRPFYKPAEGGTPAIPDIPGTPEEWKTDYAYTEDPNDIPQVPGGKPTFPGPQGSGKMPFFGYNMLMSPKRYTAYAAPMNAMTPTPTFYDPNRELAANAEIYNQNVQGLNNFGTAQGFLANSSGAAGKAAENAANIMGRYQNMNVGVANQFSPLQTDIMNKVMAYQADRADKVAFNNDQLDKEYRNQQMNKLTALGKYKANQYDYRTKRNIQNAVNPFYQYYDGPNGGNINLRPGVDAYSMITGLFGMPGQTQPTGPTSQQYLAALKNLQQSNPGLSPAQYSTAVSMMPGFSNPNTGRSNSRAMAGMLNQTMSMAPYAASNPMYNRGYDIGDLWDME